VEFFTLAEARNEARAFLGLLARGEDPFAADPDPEMTVKELIETHYKPWVTVHRKSGDSTIQSLYFYFTSFFDRSISSITSRTRTMALMPAPEGYKGGFM
jgi:hypothetical protein